MTGSRILPPIHRDQEENDCIEEGNEPTNDDGSILEISQ